MNMRQYQTQIHRKPHKSGMTLIELIMVLAISSLLIGGSLAWFDSRKSVDFNDQVRQIESEIRSIQSESSTNRSPSGGASFALGEELFGTAISISPETLATPQTTMRVYYLKQLAPAGASAQAEGIVSYSTREIQLPATLYLVGYQNIAPTDAVCSNKVKPATAGTGVTSVSEQSLVVFRQTSGSYNAFSRPDSTSVVAQAGGPRPVWSGTISSRPGWRGSYDDESYTYSGSPAAGPLASQPCAVLWRFESVERSGANARFSAEIQFNLRDGTTTVQTR